MQSNFMVKKLWMVKNLFMVKNLLIVCVGLGLSMTASAQPLEILSFKKNTLSATEQQQICQQAQYFCKELKTLRSLKMGTSSLWVMSQHRIVQFQQSNKYWVKHNEWDFNAPPSKAGEEKNVQHSIFPKLFPLDQNRYAIAYLIERTEGYSGGGAQIQRANFIELKQKGQKDEFITDYPFHLSQMIRACFSEEDYKNSEGHCHDFYNLDLDIRVIKPMLWQFRYTYETKISPASDSGEKSVKETKHININLNQIPKTLAIPEAWNYSGQG